MKLRLTSDGTWYDDDAKHEVGNHIVLDEIERLREELESAEARMRFIPSPEQWQEVQSQLRAAKARLAAAEAQIQQLRAYVADQLCECFDEYSHQLPQKCDRCRLLETGGKRGE